MMMSRPVRVRFAPSPTGRLHIGGARTALYDYLLARQTGGQFILRLEDTDQNRFVPGAEEELKRGLRWLGLEWDEGIDVGGPYGPYRQSERKQIYLELAKWLIDHGHAYYCFCTPDRLDQIRQQQQKLKQNPRYDGHCRQLDPDESARRARSGEKNVIRFKMPEEGSITVHDHLRGPMTIKNQNLDDYILIKSDGLAVYHLAAMVDDHLMKITHIMRGSEWLPTFPLHVHIIRAFGWEEPDFVHLSVFLKPSGKGKMSKRETSQLMKDGYSIFVTDLEDLGYIPEAVVNWIALMGWSYDEKTEFFSMNDLIQRFNLDRLNAAPAAINFTKLDHFNGLHIRNLQVEELTRRLMPFFEKQGFPGEDKKLLQITPLLQERLVTLDDALAMGGFFFKEKISPIPNELVGSKMTASESATAARKAYSTIQSLPELTHNDAELPLRALAEDLGLNAGQLFGILRVAVTGQKVSPPLLETMEILGKTAVLDRIQNAINILDSL